MDSKEFTGKNVEEALQSALTELNVTIDQIEYEVLEKESGGFLGLLGGKPAKIAVKLKEAEKEQIKETGNNNDKNLCRIATTFLNEILTAMGLDTEIKAEFTENKDEIDIDLSGSDMGVLIGKRGATLDSLQYLVSLVINKDSKEYIKVKLDTENYRQRRKETLENLARNIAHKVKRTRRSVVLEPMNPYERRVIHSTLQDDKYVDTHSEGDEPYRKVVVTLKKGYENSGNRGDNRGYRGGRGKYNHRYNNNRKRQSFNEPQADESTGEAE